MPLLTPFSSNYRSTKAAAASTRAGRALPCRCSSRHERHANSGFGSSAWGELARRAASASAPPCPCGEGGGEGGGVGDSACKRWPDVELEAVLKSAVPLPSPPMDARPPRRHRATRTPRMSNSSASCSTLATRRATLRLDASSVRSNTSQASPSPQEQCSASFPTGCPRTSCMLPLFP